MAAVVAGRDDRPSTFTWQSLLQKPLACQSKLATGMNGVPQA